MQDLTTLAPAKPVPASVPASVPAPAAPVPAAPAPVQPRADDAPPAAEPTPAPGAAKTAAMGARPWSVKVMRWVVRFSLFAAAVVAGIGFIGSYDALQGLAERHGFGWYSWLFPVGIDAGIIAMYGMDLVLVHRRMPKPMLRLIAHVLTLATIAFNASAGQEPIKADPLGALMHGVLPLLFVAAVEAARHLIIRTNRLVLSAESDRVPLHRWILSPFKTWGLYRRMRLWEVPSYTRMVAMEQERVVYRAWLQHKHGRNWRKKAGAEAMLPFTLAVYGLSVDEALDQPRKQQEDADRRQAAEAARKAAAIAAAANLVLAQEEADAEAQIRRMGIGTRLATAQHDTEAAKAAAAAQAKASEAAAVAAAATAEHTAHLAAEAKRRAAERAATAAERAAEREEEAEKTAAEADAEARAAAALLQAEQDRKAAMAAKAEADRLEAEAAGHRADIEARDAWAAAEKKAAAARESRAEADLAEAAAREAKALQEKAEAEAAAMVARERAARAEDAVLEAEASMRLSPVDRAVRKVARMILAAHQALPADARPEVPSKYEVPLKDIEEALAVSHTIAGQRRDAAITLIVEDGYTG
ncbi:DUF2637 domain-containing protein [Streptomyces sp. NPDC057411]|uniref:DUF2637 domain-containing protein n=1 Tax=unclassified Streptomyces TaxID=2593676 RepID=UPI003636B64C